MQEQKYKYNHTTSHQNNCQVVLYIITARCFIHAQGVALEAQKVQKKKEEEEICTLHIWVLRFIEDVSIKTNSGETREIFTFLMKLGIYVACAKPPLKKQGQ